MKITETTANICFESSKQIKLTIIDFCSKLNTAEINDCLVCFNLIKACEIFSTSSNTKFDDALSSCFKSLEQDEKKNIISVIYGGEGDINTAVKAVENHILHTNPAIYYIALGLGRK